MEKVIFSKFSGERKAGYGIVTKILEGSSGKRSVVKEAINPEGIYHIQKMPESMVKLKAYYKDDRIVITPCSLRGDRAVEFDYVRGVRYDEYVSQIISQGNYDKLKSELILLKKIMTNVDELTEFNESQLFTEIFGDCDYSALRGKESFKVSNIDMIFANIIKDNDRLYITDYEWVFDFPVPVDYVIYRSLLLSSNISMLSEDKKSEIYQLFNINEKDINLYNKMEERFQRYVSGKNLFEEYKKGSTNKLIRFQAVADTARERCIKVYSVNEDGGKKLLCRSDFTESSINLTQKLKHSHKGAVFELQSKGAVIKIRDIFALKNNERLAGVQSDTNADLVIGDDYYFKDKIPVITIENKDYDAVGIDFIIYYENTSLISSYVDKIMESVRLNTKLEEAEINLILRGGDISYRDEMIAALNEKLKEAREEIEQMKSTFAWRAYEKLKGRKK